MTVPNFMSKAFFYQDLKSDKNTPGQIGLKSQIFLFFSKEAENKLSKEAQNKAPEKKRNICDFK